MSAQQRCKHNLLTYNVHKSYETVVKRWPIILTSIIDNIYRVNHSLSVAQSDSPAHENALSEEKIEEGKGLIEQISKLKYEMGRDRPLECVLAAQSRSSAHYMQTNTRGRRGYG